MVNRLHRYEEDWDQRCGVCGDLQASPVHDVAVDGEFASVRERLGDALQDYARLEKLGEALYEALKVGTVGPPDYREKRAAALWEWENRP